MEQPNDEDAAWSSFGQRDEEEQFVKRMLSEDEPVASIFESDMLLDTNDFERLLSTTGAQKKAPLWNSTAAAPTAYTLPASAPVLGGQAIAQPALPALDFGQTQDDFLRWLQSQGLTTTATPGSVPALTPAAAALAPAALTPASPASVGPSLAPAPVALASVTSITLPDVAASSLASLTLAEPALPSADVPSTASIAPALGSPVLAPSSPSTVPPTQPSERGLLQKIESQLAFNRTQRAIAVAQLQKVREQLAMNTGTAEITQMLRGAEKQIAVRLNFLDGDMARLESRLRTVTAPPDASAQLRALRLQSGQMVAAIKSLTANIAKLATEASRLDPSGKRQLQLFKTQRHNVNMQLQRVRDEIQSLESHHQTTPTDSGRMEYTKLMGEDEKQQLINIQRMQMHSENPFVDDYYYVMHTRRLTNVPITMRVPQSVASPLDSTTPPDTSGPATTAKPAGIHFEKTLGSITYGSTRAPRALVSIENTESSTTDIVDAPCSWREAGRALESAYSLMLRLEDIEQMATNPAADRRALFEQRSGLLTSILATLGVTSAHTARDGSVCDHVLSCRKGVRLLGRLVPFLTLDQFVSLLCAILRSAVVPQPAVQQIFGNPAIGKIGELQLPHVRKTVESVAALRPPREQVPINDFHTILLYFVVRRIEAIVQHPSMPIARELDQLLDPLAARFSSSLSAMLKERCNMNAWQFVLTLSQHISPPTRAVLGAALGPMLDRDVQVPLAAALRQALRS